MQHQIGTQTLHAATIAVLYAYNGHGTWHMARHGSCCRTRLTVALTATTAPHMWPVKEVTQRDGTLCWLQQITHKIGGMLQLLITGVGTVVVRQFGSCVRHVAVAIVVAVVVAGVVVVVAVVQGRRADIEFGTCAGDTQATRLPCIVQGSDAGQACEQMDVVVGG